MWGLGMATIQARKRADGSTSYRAEIVIKKDGVIQHRESKTFDKARIAKDWAARREIELQESQVYKKAKPLLIKDLIELYIEQYPPPGRSKLADLKRIAKLQVTETDVYKLNAKHLIDHIRLRNTQCKPQTAGNDLIWLNTVLSTMRASIEPKYSLECFEEARIVLRREGLIAKSEHRDRRPTREELWKLSRIMPKHYRHIMWFAVYSCRRLSEITSIRWDDIRDHDATVIIRDLKHPTKSGVKRRTKLPRGAYKIVMRQPRTSARVFPYNPKSISASFTRTCHALGIDNLHFHDLRHHGISLLFERGLDVVSVQQVSLHMNWATLKRYTNLNPGDLDI